MSFNSKIYIIHLNGKTSRKQIRKYVCVYSSPYYIEITLYSYVFLWYTLFLLVLKYVISGHYLRYLPLIHYLPLAITYLTLEQGTFLWLETILFMKWGLVYFQHNWCMKSLVLWTEHWFNVLTDLQFRNTANSTVWVF